MSVFHPDPRKCDSMVGKDSFGCFNILYTCPDMSVMHKITYVFLSMQVNISTSPMSLVPIRIFADRRVHALYSMTLWSFLFFTWFAGLPDGSPGLLSAKIKSDPVNVFI